MNYQYRFERSAQKEYELSVAWYLARSPQAAKGFINAVEAAISKLCAHPFRWRKTYKNFYEIGLRKYPFSIVYEPDENLGMVIIYRIYHQKRNPTKKFKLD